MSSSIFRKESASSSTSSPVRMGGTLTVAVPAASSSSLLWMKSPVAWVSRSMGWSTIRRRMNRKVTRNTAATAASRPTRVIRKVCRVFITSFMLMSAMT